MPTKTKDHTAGNDDAVEFAELPSEDEVDVGNGGSFREAVLYATDWTTETVVAQLHRKNIILNPSFQRRDAWNTQQKSRFIESLVLGLPIPQIVLAEARKHRGKFIVLDGKQRLLSLMQFWRLGEGSKNGFALSGLEIRKDLARKTLAELESDPSREEDLNSLLNQSMRTVIIKNWPNEDFLHLVFLRLNTGSVKLSPQELRQALFPGPFTTWVDEMAMQSEGIKLLLSLKEPDYRMRDIEILSRYLAFSFFLGDYRGRMKQFLDKAFGTLNDQWASRQAAAALAIEEFEKAIKSLMLVFGDQVGRKPGSKFFNRAIFDCLVFYARAPAVRDAMEREPASVLEAYVKLFADPDFRSATERDTAGVPNTVARLSKWGTALSVVLNIELAVPRIAHGGREQHIILPDA